MALGVFTIRMIYPAVNEGGGGGQYYILPVAWMPFFLRVCCPMFFFVGHPPENVRHPGSRYNYPMTITRFKINLRGCRN